MTPQQVVRLINELIHTGFSFRDTNLPHSVMRQAESITSLSGCLRYTILGASDGGKCTITIRCDYYSTVLDKYEFEDVMLVITDELILQLEEYFEFVVKKHVSDAFARWEKERETAIIREASERLVSHGILRFKELKR